MLAFWSSFILLTPFVTLSNVLYLYKVIIIPFIVTFFPTFFFMPTSFLFDNHDLDQRFIFLKYYFMFGSALIAIYWITLLLIKTYVRYFSYFFHAFCLLFFEVPLLYIYPLIQSKSFGIYENTAYIFYLVLIFTGLAFILLTLIYYLIKAIRKTIKEAKYRKKYSE